MLNNLPSPKTTKKNKIVGRGTGSGKGAHTTGRGLNGQKSRSGYRKPGPAFEGGQNPLSRRLPQLKGISSHSRKRGYKTSKIRNIPISLSRLEKISKDGEVINYNKLIEAKLIKPLSHKDIQVKIVFDKDIEKKITLEGLKASETAKASIEKAGGEVK